MKIPEWAVAGIVAQEDRLHVEFQFDSLYTLREQKSHEIVRRVLIGWRKSKQNSFKELRQAASSFAYTHHLGAGCDLYRIRVFDDPDTRGSYWTDDDGVNAFPTEEEAVCRFWAAQAIGQVSFQIGYIVDRETVEHRGKQAYLKAGGDHDNGWRVYSVPVAQLREMTGIETADGVTEEGLGAVQHGETEQAGRTGTIREDDMCSDRSRPLTYCA